MTITTYGDTPRDATGMPISEVYSPNTPNSDLTAFEGGSRWQDGNGKWLAPGMVEDIEQTGYITLVSPPTQTNAGTETILTFASQVNHVEIYNGTAANINYAFDVTVTAGSLVLPPGYQLDKPKKVTAVHILTAAATNINGTSAGNIVVLGSM